MSNEETKGFDGPDEQLDSSGAVSRRPLRRRWLVFSLLAGISLAAGVATFILVLRGFVAAWRAPIPVSDESWCIWVVLVAMVVSGACWALRPSRKMTAGSFLGAAIAIVLTSFLAYPLVGSGVDAFIESGMSIPDFVGQLLTAWGCFAIAVLANIAGRAYGHATLSPSEGHERSVAPKSDDDVVSIVTMSEVLAAMSSRLPLPRDSRREESGESSGRKRMSKYVQRLGAASVGVVTAVAIAVTAPMVINERLDPFVRVTASVSASHDDYPTVEQISAAAAGRDPSKVMDPAWKVSFGDMNVRQILAGVRGAVAITDRGVYGLDSSTGDVMWSFATAGLKDSSDKTVVRSLRGVNIYAEESAFTSPDGTWLAYAFDVTLDGSPGGKWSPEDITRVVVLNTDTGRVALDTQVAGSAPVVQLTDSTTVINRRVYDTASGRELALLDDEKAAIPGPGGHSTVLTRRKEEDLSRSSWVSVDTLSDQYLRAVASDQWAHDDLYDDIDAQVIDGRVINVGGWVVVNDVNKNTIQNADTGATVSLNNEGESTDWRIVGIQASAQAVSTWSVQDYVDGEAENYGHPLELHVFDTRTGKVMTVDPAGTYRTVVDDGSRASGTSYSGAVDTAVFSTRVDDGIHAESYDDLVIRQNDATRQDRGAVRAGDTDRPWVNISLPQFESVGSPVALCPGGVVVSGGSEAGVNEVTGRKAPL
ncbi:DUF2029 domain-containing protein [Actinomyces sp. ZJ308]|uniref:DUF2029 domain-containing protein n=1 Tax=Actinomyces sp. ZJ308 TaxID=2708342 RepID=UPI001421DBE7|nr:DUF2029 domain-containing protein [Actinomyces sp. ZJ308]